MIATLREMTEENWRQCSALDPGRTGRPFIPSNLSV